MPQQAFGGAMITSVGMWGIGHAYSPLAHYYRVPVLVLVGAVRKAPAVEDDQLVVRPMLTVTATFDHRYVDGFHAAQFANACSPLLREAGQFRASSEDAFQAKLKLSLVSWREAACPVYDGRSPPFTGGFQCGESG